VLKDRQVMISGPLRRGAGFKTSRTGRRFLLDTRTGQMCQLDLRGGGQDVIRAGSAFSRRKGKIRFRIVCSRQPAT